MRRTRRRIFSPCVLVDFQSLLQLKHLPDSSAKLIWEVHFLQSFKPVQVFKTSGALLLRDLRYSLVVWVDDLTVEHAPVRGPTTTLARLRKVTFSVSD